MGYVLLNKCEIYFFEQVRIHRTISALFPHLVGQGCTPRNKQHGTEAPVIRQDSLLPELSPCLSLHSSCLWGTLTRSYTFLLLVHENVFSRFLISHTSHDGTGLFSWSFARLGLNFISKHYCWILSNASTFQKAVYFYFGIKDE